MTTIAIVSAGLSEPSSSRLLADKLANAAVAAIGSTDREAHPGSGTSTSVPLPTTSPTRC